MQGYGTRRPLINRRQKNSGKFMRAGRCPPVVFSKVLAARKTDLITARARKKRRRARVLPFDTPYSKFLFSSRIEGKKFFQMCFNK